jgi:hypothetical protein
MFEASDEHLQLMYEYGLGEGNGGPWRRRLGEAQQCPEQMLADQLIWAVQSGRSARVAMLLAHGVDPNASGSGHPTHEDRSAYEWARYNGSTDIAALLEAAGARPPRRTLDAVDRLLAAALGGDAQAVRQAAPDLRAAAIRRRPDAVRQAVDLRRPAAIRLLVETGFPIDGDGGTTPLHIAAYEGNLELVRLLVSLGADPVRKDRHFQSTPLGWAQHAHADAVVDYLDSLSSARPRSADQPGLADLD